MTEIQKTLEDLEKDQSFAVEEEVTPPSDIVAFNEMRSCAELLRMYQDGQLSIQPDFQRNIVWQNTEQTRFIDSLIKQLPIPSMCVGFDYTTDKRIVIDGLQRITTIIRFLSDEDWRLSRLSDIDQRISGKSVKEIKNNEITKNLYSRVQNVTIPITVLRCNFSQQAHMDYIFIIFHRLNTGGRRLNNQEIRNCIYNGSFNRLLKDLATNDLWESLFPTKEKDRFNNEEIILRTFAFVDKLDSYTGNLAKFLNHYMEEKQNIDDEETKTYKTKMVKVLSIINNKITDIETVKKLGKTLQEGLLVGIFKNSEHLENKNSEDINAMFNNFKQAPEFGEENIKSGLNATDKVKNRLNESISIFNA